MFKLAIQFPVSGKSVSFEPITNDDYIVLLKYNLNNDKEGFAEFLYSKYPQLRKLTIADQGIALLTIYATFIEPTVQLNVNNKQVNVNVMHLVQKLEDKLEITPFTPNVLKYESAYNDTGVTITTKLPHSIFFKSLDEIAEQSVDDIRWTNLNKKDQPTLNDLSTKAYYEFVNYCINVNMQYCTVDLIDVAGKKINVNIVSNNIFDVFCELITSNVQNQIELLYVFAKHIRISPSDFYKLTPIDTKLIYNNYLQELKKQSAEVNKQDDNEHQIIPRRS